jgi:hypothetical protein
VSWFNSSLTEFVETLKSFASSLKYELVSGLKKNLVRSFILVFDEIRPVNKLFKISPFYE